MPQILRRKFETIIDPMKMREYRIFAGPPALIIQFHSLNYQFLVVKIAFTVVGYIFVPVKGKASYIEDRKRHGVLMTALFMINCL